MDTFSMLQRVAGLLSTRSNLWQHSSGSWLHTLCWPCPYLYNTKCYQSHPEVSPSQPWHLTYMIPVAIRCSGGCCWVVTFKSLGGSSTRQSIRSEFTFISVLTVGEFGIYIFILIYIWTLAGNSSA